MTNSISMNHSSRNAHSGAQRTGARFFAFGAVLTILVGCSNPSVKRVAFAQQTEVAEQIIRNGQTNQGFRILETASQDFANEPSAQLEIADTYLQLNANVKAAQGFKRAYDLGAKTEGLLGMGRVALARNQAETARAYFTKVLERNKKNPAAINGIAVSYDLDGQHKLAQETYQSLLALDPGNLHALNNLGLSHVLSGSGEYGVGILSELSRTEGTDAKVRQNLALGYYVIGRKQEAVATSGLDQSQMSELGKVVVKYRTIQ